MSAANQGQLFLIGDASRGMRVHTAREMSVCKTLAHSVYLALQHAQITQQTAAEAIGVTDGYFSMLMCGKRHWSFHHVRRLMEETKSLAPVQWLNAQYGIGFAPSLADCEQEHEDRRRRRAA